MPLDGIRLRAPHLHNGSVPTLRDLLEPFARPRAFARGGTLIDAVRVGFASAADPAQCCADGRPRPQPITSCSTPRCRATATAVTKARPMAPISPAADKDALVEYLKTF